MPSGQSIGPSEMVRLGKEKVDELPVRGAVLTSRHCRQERDAQNQDSWYLCHLKIRSPSPARESKTTNPSECLRKIERLAPRDRIYKSQVGLRTVWWTGDCRNMPVPFLVVESGKNHWPAAAKWPLGFLGTPKAHVRGTFNCVRINTEKRPYPCFFLRKYLFSDPGGAKEHPTCLRSQMAAMSQISGILIQS